MSAIDLLERLRKQDVRISFAGERLRLNAPPGVLTPELQAEIAKHKAALRSLMTTARESDATPIPVVDRSGPLPLSPTQQRMWVLHRLDPVAATYHIVHADRLRGVLDAGALQRAWQTLAQRQESLRTRIVESHGVPSVAIDHGAAAMRVEDLSGGEAGEREAALRALMDAEAHRPFNLERGPLAELILVRMAGDDHVLLTRLHHIVSDQWSLGLLRRELAALYEEAMTGRPASLPPLPLQYVDYAAWADARKDGPEREAHLAYWRAQLNGLEPLELPSLNPRRAQVQPSGDRLTRALPAGLLDRLSSTATRAGATLFMGLIAAYAVVLFRYTGRTNFSIGTPIAGRARVELEHLIGAFINTLALRVTVKPEQRLGDLLADIKRTTLDAYAHQDVPFEQLVAALVPARQAGAPPLVQVMFNFLNTPGAPLQFPDIAVESATVDRRASPFDLSLIVDAAEHTVTAEYRPDVIPAGGIELLLTHYVRVLEAIVEDIELPVGLVPMLGGDERASILAINETASDYDGDCGIEQIIAEQARRTPDAVALRCRDAAVSYADLEQRASALALHLRGRGVGPEMLVGVCLSRSERLPIALLAVMKAGGAYLPLDPDLPPARLAWMIENSGARIVLTEAAHVRAIERFEVELVRVDVVPPHPNPLPLKGERESQGNPLKGERESQGNPLEGERESQGNPLGGESQGSTLDGGTIAHGDHLAYVLYTSGSTGQPKGVQVPRRALTNFLLAMREAPGISSGDVLVAVTTFAFDIAALELFLPLSAGATVVIASRDEVADGRRLLALASAHGATIVQGTPTTWRLLIEAGWTGTPALKALVGGEALPPDLAEQLLPRATEVWNLYGPTETTIWSTIERVTSDADVIGIGRPIANTEVYVLDPGMQLTPFGVPGELYIGGAGVARGYLGRPDLTASRFVPDLFSGRAGARLYRTGDRARLRPEGRLEYLGRLDTQVKIRGFRIELGEIEAALSDHPSLGCAVVVVHGEGAAAALVAYVVRKPDEHVDEAALRAHLRERLPAYMVPSTFVELDTVPLTPNGKIDRQALASREAIAGSRAEIVAPRGETQETLARIWRDLLKVECVSAADDFFELGGHSLLAMRLVAQIHDTFGVALEPSALFASSTLAALAADIDAVRGAESGSRGEKPVLVPLVRGGPGTPFFWVHGVGGEVYSYIGLSQHLAAERSVFGFAADWTRLEPGVPVTVQRMAERYVRELRAAHPEGPYHLGGFCSGALIALEMARQLDAAGAGVGLVAAVDFHAGPPKPPASRMRTLAAFARNLPRWWRQDAKLRDPEELLGRLRSLIRRTAARVASLARTSGEHTPAAVDLRDQLGMWRFPDYQLPMLQAHHRALTSYRLEPCRAHVAVFLPYAAPLFGPFLEQYDRGWYSLATEGVDEHFIPGSHTTMLTDPFAAVLANCLEQSIQQVERKLAADPAQGEPV